MWLTKLRPTDESRLDEDFLSYKIDAVREQLIVQQYAKTQVLDQTWFSDLGVIEFHKVNFVDDPSITYCECDISKAFLPQIISLENGSGNQDIGLTLVSTCGKKKYTHYPMMLWKDIPSEHERSMFNYRSRINTACYVNSKVEKLRAIAVLSHPEDGYLINSTPIVSGSIATGTVYVVKYAQVVYNSVTYGANTTFTGVAGVTTFSTVSGVVYLNQQKELYTDFDAYPVTGDMARMIVLEILTKEFNIERAQLADDDNDSKDDATKKV